MAQILCFFCTKICENNDVIYDVGAMKVPFSQKHLYAVFQHLANRIKIQLVFDQNPTYICENCYNELQIYDKLMLELLAIQKRLTVQLKKVIGIEGVEAVTENLADSADIKEMENESVFDLRKELTQTINATSSLESCLNHKDDECLSNIIETDLIELQDKSRSTDILSDNEIVSEMDVIDKNRVCRECEICGLEFKTKIELHEHNNQTHNSKRFICKICGVVRKDEEYLELHMNLHEGKTEYECRYCPKQFSRPVNTLRHMRVHWDKKKFQCEKCGERFSLDNMLYNHRMLHEAEENPIICSICNNSFKSRKTYNHHIRIHQANRTRFNCHICSKSFTERYTLKMHLKNHVPKGENQDQDPKSINNGDRNTDSAQENVATDVDNSVVLLISVPENGNEYNCIVCDGLFEDNESLQQHLGDQHNVLLM